MKKLILGLLLVMLISFQCYGADQWVLTEPAGTRNAADIDAYIGVNNAALDRLIAGYRQGCEIVYASASTITVGDGELVLSNSAGTTRRFRRNTSDTTVAWTDLDTGSEAISQTYYIYGVADTDATTFTCKISTSSSAPSGVTYYKRLGSFYNDPSGNIDRARITNDDNYYATASTLAISSSYVKDTIYQNTRSKKLLVIACFKGKDNLYMQGYCDSTSSPTTEVDRHTDITDNSEYTYGKITMVVPPSYYFKVTATSNDATPTVVRYESWEM